MNVEISLFIFVDCFVRGEFALMMFSANAAGRTMSWVFGSIRKCSLVTIRPNDEALVNSRGLPFGSLTTQL